MKTAAHRTCFICVLAAIVCAAFGILSLTAHATIGRDLTPKGRALSLLPKYIGISRYGRFKMQEDLETAIRRGFRVLDRDGDGIDAADLEFRDKLSEAASRAHAASGGFSQFTIYDIDQSGTITRDEIRSGANVDFLIEEIDDSGITIKTYESESEYVERIVKTIFTADGNEDDKVTVEEFLVAVKQRSFPRWLLSTYYSSRFHTHWAPSRNFIPWSAPPRKIVPDPISNRAVLLLEFDSDRDGKLSLGEVEAGLKRPHYQWIKEKPKKPPVAPVCKFPPIPTGAKVVYVSGSSIGALSSVALNSRSRLTHAARIVIEPGPEKLYLVLLGAQTIWVLEGATDRVMHAELARASQVRKVGHGPYIGVVGLSRDKILINKTTGCLNSFEAHYGNPDRRYRAGIAMRKFRLVLGRKPDFAVGIDGASATYLPSGKSDRAVPNEFTMSQFRDAREGRDAWRQFISKFNVGIVPIDPDSVVANTDVEAYEIWPSFAGIGQLLDRGVIYKLRDRVYEANPGVTLPPGIGTGYDSPKFVTRKNTHLDGQLVPLKK